MKNIAIMKNITSGSKSQFVNLKSSIVSLILLLFFSSLAWGQETATFNDGTTTMSYVPFYGLYADYGAKGQFIIPATDLSDKGITSGCQISKLKFFSSATSAGTFFGTSVKVEVGEVANTTFSSNAFVTSGLNTVLSGTSLSRSADGTMLVEFSSNYTYNGGNLLISIGGYGSGCPSTSWYGVSSTNAGVYGYNSSNSQTIPSSASNRTSYAPKTVITYFPITPYIALSPSSATVFTGFTQSLTASYGNVTGTPSISYTSSNTNVATVSGSGTSATVTAVAPGSATITASMTYQGDTYTAICAITVEDPSYCTPNPSSRDSKGITAVSFGSGSYVVSNSDETNGLPSSSPYYADYTSMVGGYEPGETATVSISYTTGYNYGTIIWVDWNKDYTFDDSEIVFAGLSSTTSQPSGTHTLNATFSIPANQAADDYRMRIAGADSYFDSYIGGSASANHSPCFSSTWSVCHDYTLKVISNASCSPYAITYTYGFEDVSDFSCWKTVDCEDDISQGISGVIDYSAWANSGSKFFSFSSYCGETDPQYLISPELSGVVNGLHVEFYYSLCNFATAPETFYVGYSTTDDNISSFTWSNEISCESQSYQLYKANFMANVKYVAVKYTTENSYYLYLDDFTFEEAASCLEPTDVTASNISTNGARISWTAGASETSWDIYYTTNPSTVPTSGTTPSVSGTSTKPYNLTGLDPATTYYVYVRAACSGSDKSDWSTPCTFNTDCNAMSLPYTNTFETGALTVCWTILNESPVYMDAGVSSTSAYAGSYHLDLRRGTSSGAQIIVLPEVSSSYALNDNYEVSFYAMLSGSASGRTLAVGVMTDPNDPSTFVQVGSTISPTDTYAKYSVMLSSYSGSGHYIAIQHYSTDNGHTFIDNLEVKQVASYTVSVSANPSAGGSASGGGTYLDGSSCTVTATPNPGYAFTNWTVNGSSVSTNASYTFTVTSNRTLVANFSQLTYTISVSAQPSAGGTVTGGGSSYTYNQNCTVTATPNTDYAFESWTEGGSVVSTNASYSFDVTGSRNLVANFIRDCGEPVAVGDHSGTATNSYLPSYPLYNYSLTQQIYAPCEIGTAGTITSIAFKNTGTERIPIYDIYLVLTSKTEFSSNSDWITVTAADKVFSGTVTMTSGVWTTIEFDTPFSYDGTSNLAVVIDDNIGSWSGSMSCLSYSASVNQSLYVYSDETNYDPLNPPSSGTLTANKNQIKFVMCDKSTPSVSYTISASASGSGTVEGAGTYTMCSDVTMTATPTGCNSFVSWTEGGDVVSTNATYSFKASSNRTLVANFEEATLSISSSPAAIECLAPETEVVLTAISGVSAPTYTWSYVGTEGSASGGTYTVSPTALTNTYTVSISECGLSQTVTVTTKPAITSVTSTAGDAACEGSDVTLNVVSSNATGYLWSEGAGSTASVTVHPEVSTTYYVTISGGDCTTVGSVGVTVKQSPTITASPDPAATCLNGSTQVTLTANDVFVCTLEDYTFTTGTDASQWYNVTNSTNIMDGTATGDYAVSTVKNIGFTFPFAGNIFTQFSVNSDGNLRLGENVTGTGNYTSPFTSSNANYNNPKINGMGFDGYFDVSNYGNYVHMQVFGTAPNRVLVVEFNESSYSTTYRSYPWKWQVQLSENGTVQIVYASTAPSNYGVANQIGLCVDATDGWTISTTDHTATHFTAGTSTTNAAASSWPGVNRYYRFTPPTPPPFAWTYTGTAGAVSTVNVTNDIYTVTPAAATNTYTVTNTETGCSRTETIDILTAANISVTGENNGVVTATCGVPLELEASGFSDAATYGWYSDEECTSAVSSTINSSMSTENIPYYVKVSENIAPSVVESVTFDYTGSEQSYTIPAGVDWVRLEVWGAQGGGRPFVTNTSAGIGGKGGYSVGKLENVTAGQTLYVYVGGHGGSTGDGTGRGDGGWNGGGCTYTSSNSDPANGGGGATDIRINGNTVNHRIIVAGGGGGGGEDSEQGGYGGGLNGSGNYAATQTTAGTGGVFGAGAHTGNDGGGAGGGWYGGGATNGSQTIPTSDTNSDNNGGSGGSGYVWTSATASSAPTGYQLTSDCYLVDAQTIAGDSEMPTHDGSSTMTGNEDNGYARITCYAYGQCIAKKPVTVNIDKPSVSIPSLSDQTICSYESFAQLSVTPSASNGELSYSWSKDDVGFDNDGATYSPTTAGAYAVTVASTLGTCSVEQSRSATLAINSPSVSISAFSNQTICAYENFAQLNAEPTAIAGTASYEWTKDGEEFSNDNATYSPTAAGTYAVTVTSTIGTCTAKQNTSAVLANYSTPVPTLVTDHTSLCLGDEATLTAGGAGTGGLYDWGSGFSDETTHIVSPTSNTDYTVVVKNSDGCTASKVLTQAVQQAPGNVPMTSVTRGHIWTGRVSSDWNDSRNWVVFTGGGSGYTIAASAPTASDQVVVRTGATCINNEPSVISNSTASNVILRNGRILTVEENRTLAVNGNINVESGAELAFSGLGTVSVSGDATIANGATVTFDNKDTLNVAGDFTLNGSFSFPVGDTTPALRIGGDLTINSGASLGSAGTLVFAGNGPQTVTNNNTGDFTIANNVRLNMHRSRAGVPHTVFPDGTIFSKTTIFEYGIMDGNVIFNGTGRAIVCGDYESYASGTVTKIGAGNNFTFPTGDDNVLGSVTAKINSGNEVRAKFHHNSHDNGDGTHGFGLDVIPRWWNVADMCSDDPDPFNHVSNFEYWDISSPVELSNVMLMANSATAAEHFHDPSEYNESDIQVVAYTNGCWRNFGGSAGISGSDHNVITITGASIPKDPHRAVADFLITLGSKSKSTVLPIELLSFTATCNGKYAELEWSTASERNNDYFVIERSADAIEFTEVGRVAGAGNSIEQLDYTYNDYGIHGGDNYYRLVQVDYDGTRTVSEIVVATCVDAVAEDPEVMAYPNPFNGELTIVLDNFDNRPATIEVYDMLGKLIYIQKADAPQNSYETILNLNNLPPAAYTVRVSTSDFVINKNVVKN